jgi:beta-glucosidase
VKELKGFQQIFLKAVDSKKISFIVTTDILPFYNDKLEYMFEPGNFKIFIGSNSEDEKEA